MRTQSKLESHQRERTVTYLAVAAKKLVSPRLSFLAERERLDVFAKEKENIGGMVDVLGEGQTQEKGKNGKCIGDTKTNVKTNVDYVVRLFALAFTDRCLEQVKVNHYARTAQIKKIRKKMHEIMYETVTEPAMTVVIQAVLSLYASDLFAGIVMYEKETGSRTPCPSTRTTRCRTYFCASTLRATTSRSIVKFYCQALRRRTAS